MTAVPASPTTLILSQRRVSAKVYQCCLYEFEDVIASLTDADMIMPVTEGEGSPWQTLARTARNRVARATGRTHAIRTTVSTESVRRDYDVFFAAFMFPSQALVLNHLQGWVERAKTKICFLGEIWLRQFEDPRERQFLEILKAFDHIFVHTASSVQALAAFTGRPCHVLPGAVDAVRFCPGRPAPPRCVDVYSMGRRSEVTHRALLAQAEGGGSFYLYDTASGFDVIDPREHRRLLANLIKRSRYFIAYRHNANISGITGGQEELGARLFEGTAGGAVLLGQPPDCDAFREHFDWDDAVVPIALDAYDIAQSLAELDAQPERIAKIRQLNVVNSLLRHDWAHRWQRILEVADLPPGPKLPKRVDELRFLAAHVRADRAP
ncbi:MAG: glycosyltransferase [Acidobacteriota bacterium]|nr:glycosyltransferase [Acidobacteriota bacterium]